jgi:hypothetical protein
MRRLFGPRSVLGLVVAGALLSTGCSTDPRFRLSRAEQRNRELSAAILAVDQAVQPVAAYASELSAPQNARGSFSMYYSPTSLEAMLSQAVPYQMNGKDFHSKLVGTITVERFSDFRFTSRNRMTCKLHLRADNVRYTGSVPAIAKSRVESFVKAVNSGGIADIEVQLTLRGSQVHAQARATNVKLRQKTSDEGELISAMNERAFNRPLIFDMSIPGSSQVPRRLLVTGNHVVVTYQ